LKKLLVIFGLLGVALFTGLLVNQGLPAVLAAFSVAGWGLLVVTAFHTVPLLADVISWYYLFPPGERPPLRHLYWMRWICASVNHLLPSASVGGDLVRARLAGFYGVPLSHAAASVVVDLTSGILMQALFTLLGVGLLVAYLGHHELAGPILLGITVATACFLGFYLVQRKGMFGLLKKVISALAGGPAWDSFFQNGESFDHAINATYKRRRAFLGGCFWTLTSWILGTGEVWLGMYFLGHPVNIYEALILESLSQAIKGALFVVPGAIGFQEGGFILLGNLFGVPPEVALSMSLVKRFREIVLGVPGLIVWQMIEGKRLLAKRAVANQPHASPGD
jgi:putative membrane protein